MARPDIHTQVKGNHLWAGSELSRYGKSLCHLYWRATDRTQSDPDLSETQLEAQGRQKPNNEGAELTQGWRASGL